MRFVFITFRFYWLVNLNSTVVFLGIAYIQQSVAENLGFLIPFTSVVLAVIGIHMMRNKLTYKPKKGNIHYKRGKERCVQTLTQLLFVHKHLMD